MQMYPQTGKNKLNLAIRGVTYEQGNDIKEMEQDVLTKEARRKVEFDGGFYEDK